MTLRQRAELWHAQATIGSVRPVWWQRAIIWSLMGNTYDKSLRVFRLGNARDTDAT